MDYLVKETAHRMEVNERIEQKKKRNQHGATSLVQAKIRSHGIDLDDLNDSHLSAL